MKQKSTGFFSSLLRDKSANTLAISAAAIIPLVGVIGGGVDASRMYLAKSRLQQACDSATLAARKKLGANAVAGADVPDDVATTADDFFENNFRTGTYGTKDTEYELTPSAGTRLNGTAETNISTTLMGVFGYDEVSIDVECSADLNLPNIDIVLVLDNSGSMRNDRIVALRDAVFAFYDEIMAAKPADARVRIGILPYNASVNVGDMVMDLDANYIADEFTYQSREAKFETVIDIPGTPGQEGTPDSEEVDTDRYEWLPRRERDFGSSDFSGNAADNDYRFRSQADHNQWGEDRCHDLQGTHTVGSQRWVISDTTFYPGAWGSSGNQNWRGACRARVVRYDFVAGQPYIPPTPPTYKDVFDEYEYKPMVFNTSSFKLGNTVGTPTGTQGATVNSTWNKCIEEATTVATTTFDPIPSGAYDLDIDLIPDPDDPDTQWRAMWPQITFDRGGPAQVNTTANWSTRGFSCPVRAWPLQQYELSGTARNSLFETRINSMETHGFTMHNIGMVWAGRMISPDGIFSATNAAAPNGEPISRHVIFMTDGNTEISPSLSDSYGNYDMDGRLAGFAADGTWSSADLRVIHNARLDATCAQIKNKNVTMWTVTFGLPQNTHTRGCASSDSRAMESDDSDQLIANFRRIATNIAELRLTS